MTVAAYWLVVPCAGQGLRFGGPVPKQYLPLGERTVLEYALAPFLADPRLEGLVVALAADDRRFATLPLAADPRVHVVLGGRERSDSVTAAVARVRERARAADPWVLVHDAVRPLIGRADIDRLLAGCADSADGALLAVPLADTLKRADAGGAVEATVDRARLWRALTPQAFSLSLLEAALAAARRDGRAVTDDAQAVEALGRRPRLVAGEPTNLKITQPADLALAWQLLAAAGSC